MISKDEIVALLANGATVEDLAAQMTDALNAGKEEYEAAQKAEEAKLKAEMVRVDNAKREAVYTKLYDYKNHTTFFRNDRFWNGLTYFLTEHFKNTKKVNVYSFGCSDGSEPYTFIMRMLNSFEKKPEKFFPIIARDFDSEAIQRAKRNNYFLTNGYHFKSL